MKKYLLIALTITLVLSLAACGNGTGNTTESSNATNETSETTSDSMDTGLQGDIKEAEQMFANWGLALDDFIIDGVEKITTEKDSTDGRADCVNLWLDEETEKGWELKSYYETIINALEKSSDDGTAYLMYPDSPATLENIGNPSYLTFLHEENVYSLGIHWGMMQDGKRDNKYIILLFPEQAIGVR